MRPTERPEPCAVFGSGIENPQTTPAPSALHDWPANLLIRAIGQTCLVEVVPGGHVLPASTQRALQRHQGRGAEGVQMLLGII